ncbi:MAG: hypothetical protein J3Q66DRAFT_406235 [Benniella sp.]|nr:MAG: hypothetical protein J3Q66DRAFT_406235 [Benniella sp.]
MITKNHNLTIDTSVSARSRTLTVDSPVSTKVGSAHNSPKTHRSSRSSRSFVRTRSYTRRHPDEEWLFGISRTKSSLYRAGSYGRIRGRRLSRCSSKRHAEKCNDPLEGHEKQPISPCLLVERLEALESIDSSDEQQDSERTVKTRYFEFETKVDESFHHHYHENEMVHEVPELVRVHHTLKINPNLLKHHGSLHQSHGQANIRHG